MDDEEMRKRIEDVVAARGDSSKGRGGARNGLPWDKSADVVRRVLLLPPLLLPLLLLLLHPLLLILQLTQVLPLFGAQALLEALEGPRLEWKAVADLVEGYGELLTWQLFAL